MTPDSAPIGPDPSTILMIRISTAVLIISLVFLAWENWKICLAMLGILFHVIMYVQKEIEGVLKMSQQYADQLAESPKP